MYICSETKYALALFYIPQTKSIISQYFTVLKLFCLTIVYIYLLMAITITDPTKYILTP